VLQFLDRQSGFIPTNHGFRHAEDPARGRRRKALAHEVELASRVEKTLSEVKSSYFPRSKTWNARAKLAVAAVAANVDQTTQAQHRVAGGSFVVYQGQAAKLKKRNENQYRQMAMLQNGCVLTEEECTKLREQFTKTSNGDNPAITFSRFLQVRGFVLPRIVSSCAAVTVC
jgi:molybdopterin converting factor small subunit